MELDILKEIIAEVLNVDTKEIMAETTFMNDLGADSLDEYQILLKIEDAFSIRLTREDAEGVKTVQDALQLILKTEQKAGKSSD